MFRGRIVYLDREKGFERCLRKGSFRKDKNSLKEVQFSWSEV